ncbi:MAG: glycoside hydrolase family 99-like domain-containing protein, partial [Pseudomonadales bacterium]|nr:glycoside hydrolase family 99-like domain-containing protein [Pseudomonadales bacterium]
ALQADHDDLQARHDALQADHDDLQTRHDALQADHDDLQARHDALQAGYREAQQKYDEITQSTSWRVTAPLRALMAGLRTLRQVVLVNNYLRLRNAVAITAKGGPGAYLQYLKNRNAAPAPAFAPLPVAEANSIKPIDIKKEDFSSAAAGIVLPVASAPLVSIIIPAYNHLAYTLACLSSIAREGAARKFEVIVVDDASSDESPDWLPQIKHLRYFRNAENLGFVHTCNKGAAEARGRYLLFLNNDTQVSAGWLDALADILDAEDTAGIVGSRLIYPSGHLQEAGADLHRDGSVTLVGLNQNPDDPRYDYLREVDHCSGAAFMIRRTLFKKLKGFDVRYAPAYFEDCDLSLRVRELGYRVYYQPASKVWHHLSVTTNTMSGGKLAQIEKNKKIYLERWQEKLMQEDRVRLIAFYLPQYHPIPENDAWWGRGFTEWTNVAKAKPNYEGHYQPHQPADLGYYDLRVAEVREQQAQLAREHGIHGFCYYYYWFDGKRLLERPLQEMLDSGTPDFPFCICWANENWTRRWDGRESEVLMSQNYSDASKQRFITELLPIFSDRRYIRINGRPLLLIYRAEQIPALSHTLGLWRQQAMAAGLEGLYLVAVKSFNGVSAETEAGFDAMVEFPPHGGAVEPDVMPTVTNPDFCGHIYDYKKTADKFMMHSPGNKKIFRCAMPSWDNTARRQDAADIFLDASPAYYQKWLAHLVREARDSRMGDERMVFVNAWNEWAEGNHLEPDQVHGHAYLEATREALGALGCYQSATGEHEKSVVKKVKKSGRHKEKKVAAR